MVTLTVSTDTLKVITSAAVQVDIVASSAVPAGNRVTEAISPTTATTTTLCAAPRTNEIKKVDTISARNRDATNPCNVTFVLDRNGTSYYLTPAITLAAGESTSISSTGAIIVFDPTGENKSGGGH